MRMHAFRIAFMHCIHALVYMVYCVCVSGRPNSLHMLMFLLLHRALSLCSNMHILAEYSRSTQPLGFAGDRQAWETTAMTEGTGANQEEEESANGREYAASVPALRVQEGGGVTLKNAAGSRRIRDWGGSHYSKSVLKYIMMVILTRSPRGCDGKCFMPPPLAGKGQRKNTMGIKTGWLSFLRCIYTLVGRPGKRYKMTFTNRCARYRFCHEYPTPRARTRCSCTAVAVPQERSPLITEC